VKDHPFDIWSIASRIDVMRGNSRHELFAPWVEGLLQQMGSRATEVIPAPRDGEEVAATARLAESAAFAWLLSEASAHAELARRCLRLVAESAAEWAHAGHLEMYPQDRADLMVAEITKACVNAASWLWPTLDEDLRAGTLNTVASRGGRVIFEDAEKGCWWADALNSNWTAVLNSGLGYAALAWRSVEAEEAEAWLQRAREVTVRMLDLASEEGAGVEGAGYWLYCFGSLQDLVEALRSTGGPDLYEHPFWRRCSRFLPYLALPDLSGWVPYADCGRGGMGGSAFFHGVAARVRDPLAQWFGNAILRKHGGAGWRNLIYFDPTMPEQPLDSEPPCRVFRSIQLASFRSGWDAHATLMLFKGGSNAWSHTHLDLNSFFIAAGGEHLATDPGPEPYSVHLWHSVMPAVSTAWHNCIVVDGAHQRMAAQYAMTLDLEEAGDCYSRLSDHLSSERIEMVRGDATSAYADTLDRAWRDLVYLKPNVFVIFDDLRAQPARVQRNFEWLLHSELPIGDVEGGLEVRGQHRRLLIQPLLPAGWGCKHVEGKVLPHSDARPLHCVSLRPYWHHKWNVDPRRSPYPQWDARGDAEPLYTHECRYLVVLQVLEDGTEPFRATLAGEASVPACRLHRDGEEWTVIVSPDRTPSRVNGIETDAEKAVIGRVNGQVHWAAVRATRLCVGETEFLRGDEAVSRVGLVR